MDAIQYLLSLEKFGIKFGLANIQTLAAALGQPHTRFKSILIAGTNGKGSVTAMTDMALRSAGLKVGRYTSPHLVRLEERFAIDGTPVDSGVLIALIQEMRVLIDGLLADGSLESPPTFFEVTTAIAFELFRRAHVDVAVLEVGLGGRLDATNIVQPICTAITSIDFDHEQYLGNTLAAIAAEKAGVLRRGIPVVVGPVPAEARDVLVSMSELSGATFVEADAGVRLESINSDGRTTIRLATDLRDYGRVQLGLRGDHQVPNALVAVRLLEQLERQSADHCRVDYRGYSRRAVAWQAADARAARRAPRAPRRRAQPRRRVGIGELPEARVPRAASDRVRRDARQRRIAHAEDAPPRGVGDGDDAARDASRARCGVSSRPLRARSRLPPGSRWNPIPRGALERAWTYCPVVCAAGSIFLVGNLLERIGEQARDV